MTFSDIVNKTLQTPEKRQSKELSFVLKEAEIILRTINGQLDKEDDRGDR